LFAANYLGLQFNFKGPQSTYPPHEQAGEVHLYSADTWSKTWSRFRQFRRRTI